MMSRKELKNCLLCAWVKIMLVDLCYLSAANVLRLQYPR